MARYEFEEGAVFHNRGKANPQVIGECLEVITARHRGRLKPADVVAEAARPGHPLHRHFIWDDRRAAVAHRLDQARALIRSVVVIVSDEMEYGKPRAYHSIADREGVAYRTIDDVLDNNGLQVALYRAALRDLQAFMARYRQIVPLCSMVSPVREHAEMLLAELLKEREAEPPRRPRGRGGVEHRPSA